MKVKSITVNTAHGDEDSISYVKSKVNPDIETMEGAAFFNAVSQQNIPYVQIRAISNKVEKRNKENWDIDKAITQLSSVLFSIFDEISCNES
jgi:futalosine hydrolase